MTSNACTDFNHTVYHLSIGSEHVKDGLEALADIGFKPAFRPERVEKERAAVLSEAQMVNDVQYRLQTQFLTAMHEDNQIHVRFPIGLEHQIANWSVDDLRAFHTRWYVPENATLFIVGDVDEDAATKQAEDIFSGILTAGLSLGEPWDYDETSLLRPAVAGRPTLLHSYALPDASSDAGHAPALKEWSKDLKVNVAVNDLLQGMQIAWAIKMPMNPARTSEDLASWLRHRLVVEAVRLRFSARWRSGVIPCSFHSYDTAREAVSITSLTIMTEPNRWQDRCEEVLQEIFAISSHGLAQEELDLAKRMVLDRVTEAADAQPWALMGTLNGYDAAGTSREVVEALIASTPGGHFLTEATDFSQSLREAAQEIDLANFNDAVRSTLGYYGGSAGGGAASARGTVIVSCPATVTEELTGRKVPFDPPAAQDVEAVLRNVEELDESEVAKRRVSAPASLPPTVGSELPKPVQMSAAAAAKDVTTMRFANGLQVRLLVMPASPTSGPARGGMRLTVPGGRAADEIAGRQGASRAMLLAMENCAVGEWSQEEVQLFRALNSVQTELKAGTDALELDVFFSPTTTSSRAALEWLHWVLKDPRFDLQGFADAQLRMKGDTTFREKSLDGRSRQAVLESLYPSHRWLDEPAMADVNKLTLGLVKKAAQAQFGSVEGLELDMVVCIPSHSSTANGLMHEETFEEEAATPTTDEDEAVAEMRRALEREICRCLGSLPGGASVKQAFQAPTPSASSRGTEVRVHLPDKEARAMVMVSGTAPGYWGRGDLTLQRTARYKGFSWGHRAEENSLYPARATELMMECLNNRLLGRVRDQLSLTYNCEIELTMFEGFDAGHFLCKVFTFPQTMARAAEATVQVLRSPGWMPFTDLEIEASKKVMAFREGRDQREDRSYWLGRIRPVPGGGSQPGSRYEEETALLQSLGADDVQLAWRSLGGLDDPVVVLTTAGTPEVAASLRQSDLPVVEHSDMPDAVAAEQAEAPAHSAASTMGFLD